MIRCRSCGMAFKYPLRLSMTTIAALVALDGSPNGMSELARRKLGRIDLLNRHRAGFEVFLQVDAEARGARQQDLRGLVKDKHGGVLPALGRRGDKLRRQRRLAGAGRADHERARTAFQAAADQDVQFGQIAGQLRHIGRTAVLAGDQARKDLRPPLRMT